LQKPYPPKKTAKENVEKVTGKERKCGKIRIALQTCNPFSTTEEEETKKQPRERKAQDSCNDQRLRGNMRGGSFMYKEQRGIGELARRGTDWGGTRPL